MGQVRKINMQTPSNKQENYLLYHKGYYGNHLKFWSSLAAFSLDLKTGDWDEHTPVALRTSTTPGIQLPNYCVPTAPNEVFPLALRWFMLHNISLSDVVVNEIGPDDSIVLQGEIMRTTKHYDLHYSEVKMLMRPALKFGGKHAHGLLALEKVRSVMDASSFDNLNRLFDEFEDAIIEFSVYDKGVGVLNLNTVFWEVRNY